MNTRHAHNKRPATGQLRILQTTDLHMHLLGYDYFADRADHNIGLSVLADAITAQRERDNTATVLFDNGDFLQGNPLADHVAENFADYDIHPLAAAMNTLAYDALTLGNHEFDYGLPFLQQILDQIDCKKVSANIRTADGRSPVTPFTILEVNIDCTDGVSRLLRIGVTGFGPPQPAGCGNGEPVQIDDIVQSAHTVVPTIKAAGADIIIALCHSGIGAAQPSPCMENAAIPLSAIAGIDVVLAGHTHEHFPDHARPVTDTTDPIAGRLLDKPAVMAGYYGSALGVIDLSLIWDHDGWQISDADVSLTASADTSHSRSVARRQIEEVTEKAHQATLSYIRKPIAQTAKPIHNYFATILPDLTQQFLADAMRDAVGQALGTDLPILAAVSPFRSGGRAGLGQYIDIPDGQIARKDVAAMFPFNDRLCAVRRTGAQIRDWLERSATRYNRIKTGSRQQLLLNPLSAGYNCDAIYGLRYIFDLRQPARYDTSGTIINRDASRVSAVTLNGRPVADTDLFVVAANSFRINGGNSFPRIAANDAVWITADKLRDVLTASLRTRPSLSTRIQPVWRFAPLPDTCAQFQSAQAAISHVNANIRHDHTDQDGLATFSYLF